MDDDKKTVKLVKKIIKNLRFTLEYRDKKVLSEEAGNNEIYELIRLEKPMAVMRLGSTETNCAYPWSIGKKPSQKILERGQYAAGIFPTDFENNAVFSKIYLDAVKQADVMALCDVYKEKEIITRYCNKTCKFIRARSIEPYYFENPWTIALKGKSVLIIHPFIETIQSQYQNRKNIFKNPDILPEFSEIQFIKAVQSAAGARTDFLTWKDALSYMCDEIDKRKFDIAIVGAGAYAMPLCAHIKQTGKMAIQMSGATQLLFGIKGKRWDNHPIISGFYNEYWVRPNEKETPPQTQKVEGGSYW